ncbi:hypothetical protein ECDEC8D_4178 [Escherichia coli DEC8D]|nr:hypothetical protein ECDEC8D_4178 [Escherichia coli DEC8D]
MMTNSESEISATELLYADLPYLISQAGVVGELQTYPNFTARLLICTQIFPPQATPDAD